MRGIIGVLSRLRGKLPQWNGVAWWQQFASRRLKTCRQRLMAGLVAVVFVVGIITPLFLTQRQAQAWYDSCYLNRRQITLNNSASSENLTDFPLRVSLTSANIDYAKTQNAGQDIRFTDSNGSTLLKYEIETWDEAGTSEVWVKVPQIDAGSTTDSIYMYYNCTTASDGQDPTAVWSNGYAGVWHLKENPSVSCRGSDEICDSTANANDGYMEGGMTGSNSVAGKVGKGITFDGGDDVFRVVDSASLELSSFAEWTISAWAKPDVLAGTEYPTVYSYGFWGASLGLTDIEAGTDGRIDHTRNNSSFLFGSSAAPLNTWTHLAVTRNATTTNLLFNGAVDGSGSSTTINNSGEAAGIGNTRTTTPDGGFDGTIDEVRVSTVQRSTDWIEAEYISQNNNMNTFGGEEEYVGPSNWWGGDWLYRRKITFDNSGSATDLINFPARVSLNSSRISYANTLAGGADIRFVDSDDATVLDHDIELWNASGTSEVWVRVPQIDAGSTTDFIWMYYGNAGASDSQNRASLWSTAGYRATWHMDENPAGTAPQLRDRSMSGVHATTSGVMTSGDSVAGKIATAVDFDGSNDAAVSSSLDLTSTDKVTVSYWYKPATTTSDKIHIEASSDFNGQSNAFLVYHNSSNVLEASAFGNVGYNAWLTTTTMTAGTWYHAVVVLDKSLVSTEARTYLNGASNGATSANSNNTNAFGNHPIYFAARNAASLFANVVIDEVRISDQARSSDWAEAEYVTGNDAMNTFGAEEPLPPEPPVLSTPANASLSAPLTPLFQLRSADFGNPDYLRYRIQVCTVSDCSSVLRTIDQTVSQTGWSGQDAQTGSAYVASAMRSNSTLASHTYQVPGLSYGTQYWWRAYAIDPAGSNTWSGASAISSFTTLAPPSPPVLVSPANGETGTNVAGPFRMRSTDLDSDYLRYKIDICSTSNCSAIVRTIDQTLSQTGWATQGANSGTAYISAPFIDNSQVAIHNYQAPLLAPNTQYWWRAYAIDPAGTNVFTAPSAISTFTTGVPSVKIQGGTTIRGGTEIGQ